MTLTRTVSRDAALSRAVKRATEGQYVWGTFERPSAAFMQRAGWGRFRIDVYPPGTNSAERRAMTFARDWPVAGVVVALVVAVACGSDFGFAVGAIVYAAGFAAAWRLTRRMRGRVHRIQLLVAVVGGGREIRGDAELFARTESALASLDERMAAGELTPAQYEAEWGQIYDAVAA